MNNVDFTDNGNNTMSLAQQLKLTGRSHIRAPLILLSLVTLPFPFPDHIANDLCQEVTLPYQQAS